LDGFEGGEVLEVEVFGVLEGELEGADGEVLGFRGGGLGLGGAEGAEEVVVGLGGV
jgi:hypothetical protein